MNRQRFDEETLTSSLQLLKEEMSSLNAPPEVEQDLRKAFRAHTATSHTYGRYWLVAAAAMILIVIGVVALRSRTGSPKPELAKQTEQQPTEQQPIKQEPRVAEQVKSPKQVAQKPRRAAVRRARNNEVANHVNREIATDFMPLGYLNPATLQDGGQIVRLELPRSALVNFGLPVNMDRYNEKVKADVLFGVDGLAHAIRFVK